MKIKEIKIPILNNEYSVIVCWGDNKAVKRTVNRWHQGCADLMSGLEDRRGVCFYKHGHHPIIALPRFPKTPTEIGTLAHESVHAINHIFDSVSEQTRDEVFAHSVGAVVRTVLSIPKKKL